MDNYLTNSNKISFSKKPSAVVCLNGTIPDGEFFDEVSVQTIIAADGAALQLSKIGIIPDYIIGDLDSIDRANLPTELKNCKLIHDPDQETNDFEKTMRFSIANKFNDIIIVGFHGGDLEHSLNNISVLKKFSDKLNLCLYENNRYGIPLMESSIVPTQRDEIVSLIPMPRVCLTTTNLRWELNHEILELGMREGARNQATEDSVNIIIHEGYLLLFVDAKLPFIRNTVRF